MKRRIWFVIVIALIIVVLTNIIIEVSNPLRRSAEEITEDILELTPIGTSMENVVGVIESNKKWEWNGYIAPVGFLKQPPPPEECTYVGTQSIRAFIGEYSDGFATTVTVFWGFDEDSKLIDVWVWKEKDSL